MPPKYERWPISSIIGEKRHVNYIVIENYKYIFKNGVTMTKFGKRFGVHNFNKKICIFSLVGSWKLHYDMGKSQR